MSKWGQKVPISQQMLIKGCKYSHISYLPLEIQWKHQLLTNLYIGPILGHAREQNGGQKGSEIAHRPTRGDQKL